jgi:hypothetical protein
MPISGTRSAQPQQTRIALSSFIPKPPPKLAVETSHYLFLSNMVDYAIENYGGDASFVFVKGSSSGTIMKIVLAGAYRKIFKAASVYLGVRDRCYYLASATAGISMPGWNSQCSSGQKIKAAQEWVILFVVIVLPTMGHISRYKCLTSLYFSQA